ncbi:tripartite tricarboxylate transporter substrate binding protein [Salipiger sp. PrR002]|uniref:tripartite tricarboxylate transporter substrate binding protein n=1 Tax=Salipiger sp. PrR002 TaxID=2706489 RepID=UPI0013B6478A|nr:tripartite tricarboxylate transporter substrate binding protein [Salipiger sp. PrR002]NDW00886.1 tripartite tricarboxylate transporter substrate binding protein [Salipiger sp. PrR002]NDW57993.1 tripartite tricarboxylate transporter substrate binding protein [Salipiger sp. PrR004]
MLKKMTFASIALLAAAGTAMAEYPEKPITMIVPWNAGGGTDAVARMLAKGLEAELGTNVAVVNRSGGAGVVGHNAMVTAPTDGYTIGFATAEMVTYYWTGNAEFTDEDFTPIGLVNFDSGAFHVAAGSDWETVGDAVEAIKTEPAGTFKMSGTAVGAAYHLAFAGFLQQQGVDPLKVTMVPSQGAAPGFQELAAGGVQIIPSSLPEGKTMMDAGRSKALAVFAEERNPAFPDVPTAEEQTGEAYSGGTWRGVVGPKDMDAEAAAKLEAAVKTVFDSEEFQNFMSQQGFGARYLDAAGFGEFLDETQTSVGEVMNAIGLAQRGS